jgi:hypothetical protein
MNRAKKRRIGLVLMFAVLCATAGQVKAEAIRNFHEVNVACPCGLNADSSAGRAHLMPDPASDAANPAIESADAGSKLYELVCLNEPPAAAGSMKLSRVTAFVAGANGDFTPDGDFYVQPATGERLAITEETPSLDSYAFAAHR